MRRPFPNVMLGAAAFAGSFAAFTAFAQTADAPKPAVIPWVARSNAYTQRLIDIELEHSPEAGSEQGLAQFDKRISKPTLADEMAERREFIPVLADLKAQQSKETDQHVAQDLEILRKAFDLRFRQEDYDKEHVVPFINVSAIIFQGLRGLLDDQVAAERRPDAIVRLRRYTGSEAGYTPLTDLLKQRALEQMAKRGVVYPSKDEVTTELGRNANYVTGIADTIWTNGSSRSPS
jgi:hypothetical protein